MLGFFGYYINIFILIFFFFWYISSICIEERNNLKCYWQNIPESQFRFAPKETIFHPQLVIVGCSNRLLLLAFLPSFLPKLFSNDVFNVFFFWITYNTFFACLYLQISFRQRLKRSRNWKDFLRENRKRWKILSQWSRLSAKTM